jgi:hypothetical protein
MRDDCLNYFFFLIFVFAGKLKLFVPTFYFKLNGLICRGQKEDKPCVCYATDYECIVEKERSFITNNLGAKHKKAPETTICPQ